VQAGAADWQYSVDSDSYELDRAAESINKDEGRLTAGSTLVEDPFGSPMAPCAPTLPAPQLPGEMRYSAARSGDSLHLSMPSLCGADLSSRMSWYRETNDDLPTITLYQDGTLRATRKGSGITIPVSAGSHLYRLVEDTARTWRGNARTSIHDTTDWTFHSATTSAETALSLAQIRFDLPVDLNNNATNPRAQRITL